MDRYLKFCFFRESMSIKDLYDKAHAIEHRFFPDPLLDKNIYTNEIIFYHVI